MSCQYLFFHAFSVWKLKFNPSFTFSHWSSKWGSITTCILSFQKYKSSIGTSCSSIVGQTPPKIGVHWDNLELPTSQWWLPIYRQNELTWGRWLQLLNWGQKTLFLQQSTQRVIVPRKSTPMRRRFPIPKQSRLQLSCYLRWHLLAPLNLPPPPTLVFNICVLSPHLRP